MKVTIQTCTPNPIASELFYRQLNFTLIEQGNKKFYTDGNIVIEINNERTARKAIKLYSEDRDQLSDVLSKKYSFYSKNEDRCFELNGGLSLIVAGQTLNLDKDSSVESSVLGHNQGASFETFYGPELAEVLVELGFQIVMGKPTDAFFVMSVADVFSLAIMKPNNCPHHFSGLGLNYFNGKENVSVIDNIRKTGIPIKEEITAFNPEGMVDNVYLEDPGGLGFFIFSD